MIGLLDDPAGITGTVKKRRQAGSLFLHGEKKNKKERSPGAEKR